MDVQVTYKASSGGSAIPETPTKVKLSFASATGTSCSDSWYPALAAVGTGASGALAYPGQPFASTATSGSTESASGDTGSYSVCADYTTGGKTYENTVTGVQNTSFTSMGTAATVPIAYNSTQGSC